MRMNRKEELIMCFPLNLKEDVQVVIDNLKIKDKDIHERSYSVKINDILLTIPERIYFSEPDIWKFDYYTETYFRLHFHKT